MSSSRYLCWFEQNFPVGKEKDMRNIIEGILTTFGEQPQYENDVRMMKTWFRYVSLVAQLEGGK